MPKDTSPYIYPLLLKRDEKFEDYPTNRIFLIKSEKPTLIDSGHPSQWVHVKAALKEHNLNPEDIKQIYYTGHSADAFGNAQKFSESEHFHPSLSTFSNDLRHLLTHIEPHIDPDIYSEIKTYLLPSMPPIKFTSIQDGDHLEIGGMPFDIVSTGSRTFYIGDEFSFIGEIPMGRYPALMPDRDAFQRLISRGENMAKGKIYSTFRAPFEDASWFFKQTQRFFQTFQETAKFDISLPEFCKRDLGGKPDDEYYWAFYLLRFSPFYT